MARKQFIIFLLLILTLTSCAQIEAFIPLNSNLESAESVASLPSSTPSPKPPTATVPSPTLTISLIPSLTHTQRPTNTPRPSFTPSVTVPQIIRIGPDNFPEYVNPLTGLTAINPLLLNRRPIAVKVPLFPLSTLPRQSGISLADHVYEYYLEDGLTRFVAVFYGNDALRAGPIRSGRIFDAHILEMYNAFLVFNGAYKTTMEYFEEIGLDDNYFVVERPGISPLFRDVTLSKPNNVFLNTHDIEQYASDLQVDNSRPNLNSNYFYSLGGSGKPNATRIYLDYSYTSYSYWEYDFTTKRYLRNQGIIERVNGQEAVYSPLIDSLTEEPVAAENIVVLFVPHDFFYKSSDSEIININLVDSGSAYVFRNGKFYEAAWERKETYKPLSIFSSDGLPFPLKPGVTFFQVIHTESQTIQNDQDWTFIFARPEE
jgi:hypothetical protein